MGACAPCAPMVPPPMDMYNYILYYTFILYQQLQVCVCFMSVFTESSAPSPASPGPIPGAETPPSSLQAEIKVAGRNSAMQIICVQYI